MSLVNPDYTQLRNLLAQKHWKEADLETRQLMLHIAGADHRRDRLLTQSDIQQFPCFALSNINQLWLDYSQGRFGFSVIKTIYQSVGKDFFQLAGQVGWRCEQRWIDYNQIIFDSDAPTGHLPITWLVPTSFWMYWSARFASPGCRLLLERLEECNTNLRSKT